METRKSHSVDVVIIGAGAVGCATALALKKARPKLKIVILEKNSQIFSEASRYNSGVIHSGIHQESGLLKSRLARTGSRRLIDFCEIEKVPFRKCGMIIAIARSDIFGLTREVNSLSRLWWNSRRQKISLQILTRRGIQKYEPEIQAVGGIYIPDVWIIDQLQYGLRLAEKLLNWDVGFRFRFEVIDIKDSSDPSYLWDIFSISDYYRAKVVINSAGVSAPSLARMIGVVTSDYVYRGEYYEVIGHKKDLIKSALVYPALPPGHPVKGIHLTKTVDGRLLIGPNATPWSKDCEDLSVRTPPGEFLAAARRFLPSLEVSDLRWSHAGRRAKINDCGNSEVDFSVTLDRRGVVNLLGIESPGLTASLTLGEYVSDRILQENFLA